MLIIHRTAQLGAVGQKRPQVWESRQIPPAQQDHVGVLSLAVGSVQKLTHVDTTYAYTDIGAVKLGVGDHKLVEVLRSVGVSDELGMVRLGVGDHKLRYSVLYGYSIDDSNVKVSLAVGDHKLYEE